MNLGCRPDGGSLANAMRTALAVPIIWADDARRSHLVPVMVGAATAAVLTALYGWCDEVRFVFAGLACVVLVQLACIDARVCLLPDALTQPLLWLGLACAWAGIGPGVHDSVAGVFTGYLLLALPRWLWLWWRSQDAFGAGDVKMLAALGAWAGVDGIIRALAVACMAGAVFAALHQRRWRPSGAYPFGPFLALAGVAELLLQSALQSGF